MLVGRKVCGRAEGKWSWTCGQRLEKDHPILLSFWNRMPVFLHLWLATSNMTSFPSLASRSWAWFLFSPTYIYFCQPNKKTNVGRNGMWERTEIRQAGISLNVEPNVDRGQANGKSKDIFIRLWPSINWFQHWKICSRPPRFPWPFERNL